MLKLILDMTKFLSQAYSDTHTIGRCSLAGFSSLPSFLLLPQSLSCLHQAFAPSNHGPSYQELPKYQLLHLARYYCSVIISILSLKTIPKGLVQGLANHSRVGQIHLCL